ncbi:5-formyltetrahydrofolate cyclo-ligase [Costertonia aggregata]|uniref:5-formyltetrahydrofolate cyclo-ligase n=1 Tax=Costertonia aggregata TaxID=343403 RepID=A0A7H9AQ49_9FLAO|nr:5-formyltetrahydrofolate cyclo-ligase [Costertonia aggregata]QLG45556.1 5-formyltetrahydrofolate cyclo-ligase [Costertonia aggregata]
MLKQQLRLDHKQKRNSLSPSQIDSKSLLIANRLLSIPIWSHQLYHIFLTITENKEIQTNYILSILQGKDKNIVVPKVEGKNLLRNYLLTDGTVLKKNTLNIPEPVEGIEIPSEQIDVVFVPLLAFDKKGNRVGYGKGYYDRFLSACRPKTLKIGLSLFEAEKEIITDLNDTDIPLDYCVTPEKTYSFSDT